MGWEHSLDGTVWVDTKSGECIIDVQDWIPGTSISAAWELVEKLQDRVYSMDWETGWRSNAWHVHIRKHEDTSSIYGFATTAPLAICRAAIKANGK
jgi:hypothetical protein